MKYYNEESYRASQETQSQEVVTEEIGCGFCQNKKRNRDKELFFLDNANNMRVCNFCPYCGRKYSEVE